MNTQTVNQLTPSATSTCFMAIELSNTSWLIGMMTPLSDKISLRKIDSGAVQQLIEIIDRARFYRHNAQKSSVKNPDRGIFR